MPYFVYKISPRKRLELVDTFERYRDAKVRTRSLRAELRADDDHIVKMIFAQNVDEAERLLTEVREPRPLGEE